MGIITDKTGNNTADAAELEQIVRFCTEIDKEKIIQRHTYLTDGVRFENDAEHAWHLGVMAILLSGIDVLRVVSIVLVHDLVEVYAGDTFAYDEEGKLTQKARALQAILIVRSIPTS